MKTLHIANPAIEQISQTDLKNLQLERLRKILKWSFEKSLFFREKFLAKKISKEDLNLQTLDDLKKFPMTTQNELFETQAQDFLTLPFASLSRISLWKASAHMYTSGDIQRNIELAARYLVGIGVNRACVVGILGDLANRDLMDVVQASEILGATSVLLSGEFHRAKQLLDVSRPNILIGSAHDLLQFLESTQTNEKNFLSQFGVEKILCLHNFSGMNLFCKLQKKTSAQIFPAISSALFGTMGIFAPCADDGLSLHLQEDCFFPEILELPSEKIFSESQNCTGELVLTTLTAQAMPMIRVRTGQIVTKISSPCACGRTLVRVRLLE